MKEKLFFLGLYLLERERLQTPKWLEDFSSFESLKKKYSKEYESILSMGQRELERARKMGANILFYNEPAFPEELRNIPYPPLFVYVKGQIPGLPKFAIVGSRNPTPYGKEVAYYFAQELAKCGFVIVSGLARGIDTIAHRATLEAGGKTIAIMGSGLDIIYPSENKELADKIGSFGGALISEFPFGTKPRRENFPRRNRLISGLSQGILVVEASEKSGTFLTAKWAQEQGREVFAIPGSIFSEKSKGTHILIKEGAIPVSEPKEILDYYGIKNLPKKTPSSVENLSEEEKYLWELLSPYPMHLEEIIHKSGKSPAQVLQILTQLEIEGKVKSLPGKFYQRLS